MTGSAFGTTRAGHDATVPSACDLDVSPQGQIRLPADACQRWNLVDGGDVSYLDLGESILIVPGPVAALRRRAIEGITPEIWADARRGFGDPDLADG